MRPSVVSSVIAAAVFRDIKVWGTVILAVSFTINGTAHENNNLSELLFLLSNRYTLSLIICLNPAQLI